MGVMAHEAAHIAGGHLVRLRRQVSKLSTAQLITTLLGAAALGASVATETPGSAEVGKAVIFGGQSLTQRTLLAYARAQEATADQAAVKYLERVGLSGRGMLDLFHTLANKSLTSANNVDPYLLSHPMPLRRISNLRRRVTKSKYFKRPDPPALVLRHKLMQAKLTGFLGSPAEVYRSYPSSNRSLPAQYARAIAAFKLGDMKNALPIFNRLIKVIPQNPYFHEMKGQALLESGRPKEAIAPLRRTVKLIPNNGLVRIMLGQAYIGAGGQKNAKAALVHLRRARISEKNQSSLYLHMARGACDIAQHSASRTFNSGIRAFARTKGSRCSKGKAGKSPFEKGHACVDPC